MLVDMRRFGQSLIEVTVGITTLGAVVLILLDLSIMLWGVEANDLTCRSAARAAASSNPAEATERAQTVVDRTNECNTSTIISNSLLVAPAEVYIASEPVPQCDPISGKEFNPGGPVTGTVTATTEVEIRPFVIQCFFGKGKKLTFRSQHTFPITYVESASRPPSNQQTCVSSNSAPD